MTINLRFKALLPTLAALLLGMQQALAVKPAILNRVDSQSMEKWVTTTYEKMTPEERIT